MAALILTVMLRVVLNSAITCTALRRAALEHVGRMPQTAAKHPLMMSVVVLVVATERQTHSSCGQLIIAISVSSMCAKASEDTKQAV